MRTCPKKRAWRDHVHEGYKKRDQGVSAGRRHGAEENCLVTRNDQGGRREVWGPLLVPENKCVFGGGEKLHKKAPFFLKRVKGGLENFQRGEGETVVINGGETSRR